MSFDEVRFPDDLSYQSAGGPGFSTSIIEGESGIEERVARWANAKRTYDVAYAIKNPSQLHDVIRFYMARLGCANGFRYKDWIDYATTSSGNTHVGDTTGIVQAVSATDEVLVALDATHYQLVKRYISGSVSKIRYLTKPVAGTVKIALDATPTLSGWTVDTTTGVVTFTSPPGSAVVTGGCEFDVPVRFGKEIDQAIMAQMQDFGYGQIQSIPLVELANGLKIAEDANCGASAEICLTADYQLSAGIARFLVFEPDGPGHSVLLPDTTDLAPGGPMCWLLNVGPDSIDIKDFSGAAFTTLTAGNGVVLALSIDPSDVKIWYLI